jgi:hypothetical protein
MALRRRNALVRRYGIRIPEGQPWIKIMGGSDISLHHVRDFRIRQLDGLTLLPLRWQLKELDEETPQCPSDYRCRVYSTWCADTNSQVSLVCSWNTLDGS